MITIFCEFSQFSAKKLAFFLNTNVMINFFSKFSLVLSRKRQFFSQNVSAKIFFKIITSVRERKISTIFKGFHGAVCVSQCSSRISDVQIPTPKIITYCCCGCLSSWVHIYLAKNEIRSILLFWFCSSVDIQINDRPNAKIQIVDITTSYLLSLPYLT
jgi:hypothetical protein